MSHGLQFIQGLVIIILRNVKSWVILGCLVADIWTSVRIRREKARVGTAAEHVGLQTLLLQCSSQGRDISTVLRRCEHRFRRYSFERRGMGQRESMWVLKVIHFFVHFFVHFDQARLKLEFFYKRISVYFIVLRFGDFAASTQRSLSTSLSGNNSKQSKWNIYSIQYTEYSRPGKAVPCGQLHWSWGRQLHTFIYIVYMYSKTV